MYFYPVVQGKTTEHILHSSVQVMLNIIPPSSLTCGLKYCCCVNGCDFAEMIAVATTVTGVIDAHEYIRSGVIDSESKILLLLLKRLLHQFLTGQWYSWIEHK